MTSFPSEPVVGLIPGVPKPSDPYHLLYAPTICKPDSDGKVTLCLLNPSSDSVLIHKGSTIGKFEETSDYDDISPLASNTSVSSAATIPKADSKKFTCLPSQILSPAENRQLEILLAEYADIFVTFSLDLGHTSIIEH